MIRQAARPGQRAAQQAGKPASLMVQGLPHGAGAGGGRVRLPRRRQAPRRPQGALQFKLQPGRAPLGAREGRVLRLGSWLFASRHGRPAGGC